MKKRYLIYTSTSLLGLLVACPALAQTAPNTDSQPAAATTADQDQSADIVVRGIRSSLAKAEEIKRTSDNVVDSIVAEDIGKFPDTTTASALQRVPGVQVTVGDNNEIVGPIIRGLADIESTLNGREIFTGAGRGFAFQDLPAEALARADVYKTSSANLLEGGVAGTIDLHIHKPFDFKKGLTIAGTLRGTYALNTEHAGKTINPTFGLLVSDHWDTGIGELGALVDLSYSRNQFNRPIAFDDNLRSGNHGPAGADGIAAPSAAGGLNQFGHYSRPQVNVQLQWKPSPELEVYGEGMFVGYRERSSTSFILNDAFSASSFSNVVKDDNCADYNVNAYHIVDGVAVPGGNGFHDDNLHSASNPNGTGATEHLCNTTSYTANNPNAFTSNQAHARRTNFYLVAGGVKYDNDRFHADLDASYEYSIYSNRTFIIDIGKKLPQLNIVTNDDGGINYDSPGNPLGSPDGFYFTNGLDQDFSDSIGKLYALKGDVQYDFDSILQNIQAGFRIAKRDVTFRQSIINPSSSKVADRLLANNNLPANFFAYAPGDPRMNNGARFLIPSTDALLDPDVQDQLKGIFGEDPGFPSWDPKRTYVAGEKTYAGYLQGKYQFDLGTISIDGLIGARVTRTDRDITGSGTVIDPDGTPNVVAVTRHTSDTDVLPNASARIKFGGGLQARLVYAKALSRPGFGSLNPGLNYQVSTNPNIQNGGSSGNPDLKPEKADSYDATLEYYFGRSNYISVGVYKKDIKNRIANGITPMTIGGITYQITQPRNLGSAKLKGVEASGQLFFDFLPGALSGLGVFGNYTIADSKVTTKGDPLEGSQLLGVSKYNYTAGLLYEKYGFSGRVVYTHRSHYYDGDLTGALSIRPVDILYLNGVQPSGRLDFGLNYDLNEHLTLSIDGTNVLRAKYKSYYGIPLHPHDVREDDSTYSMGVRFTF
jgi:TonB-dependent receptor